jgi:hypothetical protein
MSADKPTSDDKPTEPEKIEAPADEAEDTEAESEDETETESESSPSAAATAPSEKRSGKSKKRRERERAAAEAAAKKSGTNAIAFALVGLAAGAAVGWFGHIAQAKAKLKADAAPVPAASGSAGPVKTGPCATLEKEFCAKTGETSAACEQVKGAAGILTTGTCEVALETVPAMVQKVKAARAVCDALVARLCKDLTPTSGACGMVKERTPSFPPDRCAELNKNYEQVLAELQQMEQRGMIPGTPGVQAPGMPPGQPGMPPGQPGMPPGQPGMPPGHGPGDGHDH